jgi:hypothetical protein
VPFDVLDLVLRLDIEPGPTQSPWSASDDGTSTWVEAFDEPDEGAGIFLASARLTVTEPASDAGELMLENLEVQLITDDYTASGWLSGARLGFHDAGTAELTERRDAQQSFWRVTSMPPLTLVDATRSVEGEFEWVSEAPSEAMTPTVWLDTGEPFASVYMQFVRYRRVGVEGEP